MAENLSQQNSQSATPELLQQVGELIVHALNLDISADEIAPDEPLYGEGLGLDSIDILEVALVVSKNFGIQLRADSEDNQRIFKSLRSLSDYIATHRTQ
jgi:acyl carrier protein